MLLPFCKKRMDFLRVISTLKFLFSIIFLLVTIISVLPPSRSTVPLANPAIPLLAPIALRGSAEPFNSKPLYALHNLILCAWSAAMFLGTLWGIYRYVTEEKKGDWYEAICDHSTAPMHGTLAFWSYQYYLSKYYELLDTVILVMKKKKLIPLHIWHHAIIVPLSYSWIWGNWTLHWLGIVLNTFIHVFMYFYYFASLLSGYNPWWKRYITTGQITQFAIVFLFICIYTVMHVVDSVGCHGHKGVVAFSQFVNITFLTLFALFYRSTYKNAAGAAKSPSKAKSRKSD